VSGRDWVLAVALIFAMAIAVAICLTTAPRSTVNWQPVQPAQGTL